MGAELELITTWLHSFLKAPCAPLSCSSCPLHVMQHLVLSDKEGRVFFFNFTTLASQCLLVWAWICVFSEIIFLIYSFPPLWQSPTTHLYLISDVGLLIQLAIFFPFVGDELDEWIKAQGWTIQEDGKVFICNQEAHIKSKNIAEKIDFECKWLVGFYA